MVRANELPVCFVALYWRPHETRFAGEAPARVPRETQALPAIRLAFLSCPDRV